MKRDDEQQVRVDVGRKGSTAMSSVVSLRDQTPPASNCGIPDGDICDCPGPLTVLASFIKYVSPGRVVDKVGT